MKVKLTVRQLIDRLGTTLPLEQIGDPVGLERQITSPEAASPGLVLSGYFITRQLVRELDDTGGVDVGAFYRRRAIRLLPVLLVVLLTTLALVMTLYAPIDRPFIASHARAVALYGSNVELARSSVDYFSTQDNPLLHTWSLAVEEQFYLVWPLLFLAIGWFGASALQAPRSRKQLFVAITVAGVVSFAFSVWMTSVAQPWAFSACRRGSGSLRSAVPSRCP